MVWSFVIHFDCWCHTLIGLKVKRGKAPPSNPGSRTLGHMALDVISPTIKDRVRMGPLQNFPESDQ